MPRTQAEIFANIQRSAFAERLAGDSKAETIQHFLETAAGSMTSTGKRLRRRIAGSWRVSTLRG